MLIPVLAVLSISATAPRPLLLAHYMPWYESKPVSGNWGWHWTMGKLDPDKGQVASHYRPLIGLYDSGDPDAIECHVLQMKLAGIDGVFVDWYGNVDHFDYAMIHRNTQRLFEIVKRAKMKFALVYEDQTVPKLLEAGKLPGGDAVAAGKRLFQWVDRNWFRSPAYLKLDGRPVLLVFGPRHYREPDWKQIFAGIRPAPAFFTLHHRHEPAIGAYDWPLPKDAPARAAFFERAKEWKASIPVAYPRFHDYYEQAGVHESWGTIPDEDGRTYERTLREALSSGAKIVQVATWNDWGEGTGIEPSDRYGYRDLETTQRFRPSTFRPMDLRLPAIIYSLKKQHQSDPRRLALLKQANEALFAGDAKKARVLVEGLGSRGRGF